MTSRAIKTEEDRQELVKFLTSRDLPMTVSIQKGAPRSAAQNRLQRQWLLELQEQGDMTAEEYRGYCKLTMGVPILRAENEEFREKYDRIIKPHSYADKLAMMMEPLDFPVTRLMTTKQLTRYLDQLYQHFREQGFALTDPEGYR